MKLLDKLDIVWLFGELYVSHFWELVVGNFVQIHISVIIITGELNLDGCFAR